MPGAIKRFCGRPGCPQIISGASYCNRHKPKEKPRESASKRQYDRTWRKRRAAHLREEPLCRDCKAQGIVTAANEVHHIVALRKGGERLAGENLMSLCKVCHSKRTIRGE